MRITVHVIFSTISNWVRFSGNPRAVEPEELLKLVQPLMSGLSSTPELQIAPEPVSAWELAQRGTGPDDLICITGSFFLAPELRSLVQ